MHLGLRVASAITLLAVVAAALVLGRPLVDIVLGLVVLVGAVEYARLMARLGASPPLWVLLPLSGWLLFRFELPGGLPALELGLGAAVVVGLLGALVVRAPRAGASAGPGAALATAMVVSWSAAVGGALYLGLSFGYYLALLAWHSPDLDHLGLRIVATVLAAAFAGDTAALFAGRVLGRHPFFTSISPHKTLEGAVAGAVATVAVLGIAGAPLIGLTWYQALALGALVAIAAQGGDLVESALKRSAGVKDSSNLIPGHGGLLDRLDSLVLIGPVVYCYLRLIGLQ